MQLKSILSALFLSLSFLAIASNDNDPKKINAALNSVTVYRSGAEMSHTASTELPAGKSELILEGISNTIDVSSIQIHCAAAVTILSVEFSNNYLVVPGVSAHISLLTDSATRLKKDLAKLDVLISTTAELIDVLKVNKDIKGAQTGLSVTELAKLMDYYKTKSLELQNEFAGYEEKNQLLQALLSKVNAQIATEQSQNRTKAGQLNLQLSVAVSGKYDLMVSYLTPNAYWTPGYDIRVENIRSPLRVIYKAKVVQTTGLDWKKIKLSLATSLPNQHGNAPVLKSWFLAYINPVSVLEKNLGNQAVLNQLEGRVSGVQLGEVVVTGYATQQRDDIAPVTQEPLYLVNGAEMTLNDFNKISPDAIKSREKLKPAAASALYGTRANGGAVVVQLKDGLSDYVSVADNELNVTFDIDLPYDVPTNGKEQTAILKEYTVPASYQYYSVPRLDKDAYLLAAVPDWEKLNLLPGDANIIFEGTYVGKSFIDPVSTSDTLNLTLGHDKRMIVKKEKLVDYSSVKFLGNYKLQKFTYELTVKNNKKDSTTMLLKDQFPLSTLKEIEVNLTDNGGATVNNDTGVLTWELQLSPGENKKLRFSYTIRYPKEKLINLK